MINRELSSDVPGFRKTEHGYFHKGGPKGPTGPRKSKYRDAKWIGRQFGNLVVQEVKNGQQAQYGKPYLCVNWVCLCKCGRTIERLASNVATGMVKGCGCNRPKPPMARAAFGRPLREIPLHTVWVGMSNRCHRPKDQEYHNYGGRGISVCDEWRCDFKAFYIWAMANGYKEGLTIDRINNDGNYEPSNCRWATWVEQCLNRRTTRWFIFRGERLTIPQACERFNLRKKILRRRIWEIHLKPDSVVPENLLKPEQPVGRW